MLKFHYLAESQLNVTLSIIFCINLLLLHINANSLTFEVSPTAFLGGCPLTGRGASGVVWIELDLILFPWELAGALLSGLFCLGLSSIPNMWDFVLPPLPALPGRAWRPLGGLWWRDVDVPVTDRLGWEFPCQKLIASLPYLTFLYLQARSDNAISI